VKKLIEGITDFKRRVRPGYAETFARLALGQKPDCLMIACSDSRVVPNLFASTDPGDLFVVRNVGNFVPPFQAFEARDRSAGAAVEFAAEVLKVGDVVVVGHSGCGAMQALISGTRFETSPTLSSWLELGRPALEKLAGPIAPMLSPADRLSQLNVLEQLNNLRSYPGVKTRLEEGSLKLHAWWFDIAHAEVLAWAGEQFLPIVGD
jgi:carbonic anhydrase